MDRPDTKQDRSESDTKIGVDKKASLTGGDVQGNVYGDSSLHSDVSTRSMPGGTGCGVSFLTILIVLTIAGSSLILLLPEFAVGPSPTATCTQSAPPIELEIAERASNIQSGIPGQIEAEYPMSLSPGSSDTFLLTILVPQLLASARPVAVSQVTIPDDVPRVIRKSQSFATYVYITETMRAELSSPAFEIDAHYKASQNIDVRNPGSPTYWTWTIKPRENKVETQVLTLLIYPDNSNIPWWSGHFEIDILRPSPTPEPPIPAPTSTPKPTSIPTPTPTATPMPPLKRAGEAILDDFPAVLSAMLVFIVGMMGLWLKYGKTQQRIEDLEDKVSHLSKARDEKRENLEEEIEYLKSIKWWQFWRR
jgi:hypothetical protein